MQKNATTEELGAYDRLEPYWMLTLTSSSDVEGCLTYWFGRKDRSDDMRATKIVAGSSREAWLKLDELLEGLRS